MPSEMVLITLCLRFAAAHILNIVRLCPYRLASDNSKSTVLWLGSSCSDMPVGLHMFWSHPWLIAEIATVFLYQEAHFPAFLSSHFLS